MAMVAPASCSFWAMPQAMERLLASPKTTAVLPARLIILAFFLQGPRFGEAEPTGLKNISYKEDIVYPAAHIDQFDLASGLVEKAGAEALKFLDGISGKAADLDLRGRRMFFCVLQVEEERGSLGGGLGGIDDVHSGGNGAFNQRAQQRVVRAAEDQCVGIHALGGGFGGQFRKIDANDLGGNSYLRWGRRSLHRRSFKIGSGSDQRPRPSFLDQRDEQRTGLFQRAHAPCAAGGRVGVALDGGAGGDDQHVAGARGGAGSIRARFNDAQHRNRNRIL